MKFIAALTLTLFYIALMNISTALINIKNSLEFANNLHKQSVQIEFQRLGIEARCKNGGEWQINDGELECIKEKNEKK